MKFFTNLLDYFFYKKCYLCTDKANKGLICNNCYEKIKKQAYKKERVIKGIKVQGFFSYEGEIRTLIRGLKYHNKKDIAKSLAMILSDLTAFNDDIEIVPVPLHEERQKKRKYNHMQLIAEEMGIKVNTNTIKRLKDTDAQYRLSQKQRKDNLKDAFKVFPEEYTGRKIVLFDDICTTGATLEEIINELKKNNINNIETLVISFAGEKAY